jgi:hypothetical protein
MDTDGLFPAAGAAGPLGAMGETTGATLGSGTAGSADGLKDGLGPEIP